jgi:hypothetical protein
MLNRAIPTSHSQYPPLDPGFYNSSASPCGTSYASFTDKRMAQPAAQPVRPFRAPVTATQDVWRDQTCADNQLDLQALMPASWRDVAPRVLEGKDDWSKYTVSKEGFHKYISGSGASKIFEIERSAYGKKYGVTSGIAMLRSQPLPCLTLGEDAVIFNDSSDRKALASSRYFNSIGCGQ